MPCLDPTPNVAPTLATPERPPEPGVPYVPPEPGVPYVRAGTTPAVHTGAGARATVHTRRSGASVTGRRLAGRARGAPRVGLGARRSVVSHTNSCRSCLKSTRRRRLRGSQGGTRARRVRAGKHWLRRQSHRCHAVAHRSRSLRDVRNGRHDRERHCSAQTQRPRVVPGARHCGEAAASRPRLLGRHST